MRGTDCTEDTLCVECCTDEVVNPSEQEARNKRYRMRKRKEKKGSQKGFWRSGITRSR